MPNDTSRTFGIHIYTPLASDYRVEIEREVVRTYENGDTARMSQSYVHRRMSALAAKALPAGPVTINNYAELGALISACATLLAAEDAAAVAAAEAALAAEKAALEAAGKEPLP